MSDDDRELASGLSERDVQRRMTAFTAALARMDDDPREATRIQALVDESDAEVGFYSDEIEDQRGRGLPLAGTDLEVARAYPRDPGTRLREDEIRVYQFALEADYKLALAEQKETLARQRSELIAQKAEIEAEARRKEAELEGARILLKEQRELLDKVNMQPSVSSARYSRKAALVPGFFVALTGMLAPLVLFAGRIPPILAIIIAASIAFSLTVYAMGIGLSVYRMNHPRGPAPGSERALRLLLGVPGDLLGKRRRLHH